MKKVNFKISNIKSAVSFFLYKNRNRFFFVENREEMEVNKIKKKSTNINDERKY